MDNRKRKKRLSNNYRMDPRLEESLLKNEVSQIDKSNKKRKILYWVITLCVMLFISLLITAFLFSGFLYGAAPNDSSFAKRESLEEEIVQQISVVKSDIEFMPSDFIENDTSLTINYKKSVKTIIDCWLTDYTLFRYDDHDFFHNLGRISHHHFLGKNVNEFLIRDSVFHESIATAIHIIKELSKQNSSIEENKAKDDINNQLFEIIKDYLNFKDNHNNEIEKLKNYLNRINDSSELEKQNDNDSTSIEYEPDQFEYINSLADNLQLNSIVYRLLFTCNMVDYYYQNRLQEKTE